MTVVDARSLAFQGPGGSVLPPPVTGPAGAAGARITNGETDVQAGELAPRFDDVYRAHFQQLVVQLYAYVGDMTEAQDLVQEAFSRAWPRWDRIARYDDPVAWVRRVAWNTATSRWRRLRTARRYLERQRPENVPGPGPDRVALTAALATLPPNQRRAVVLHHLAGLSINEIALECEVAPGTVKSWLHRARTALAARLGETGAGGQPPDPTPGTARKPPEPTSRMEVI